MPTDEQLAGQLVAACDAMDKRTAQATKLERYADGDHPIPNLVTASKAINAYRFVMELADTNWPSLIVDSVVERLEIQGMRLGDDELNKQVWEIWQENCLDEDSSLAHQSGLTTSRAFAIVWPSATLGGIPEITVEHISACIVQYAPGSRHRRLAALRRWVDGEDQYATLYRPEGVYKFEKLAKRRANGATIRGADGWERREVLGETWPLANPFGARIPVVEIAFNRDLRPSTYGRAAGEFEKNTGHIDRINFATFAQIVAMTWSGFPMRALIGEPILRDDDGNALKPFDVSADRIVQLENPDAKLVQLPEADLDNYGKAIDRYVHQLAAITKTPAHYLLGQLVNISADAIRASEAGLVSKSRRHRRGAGEAWEEVSRLACIAKGIDLSGTSAASAETIWSDLESRSMAERADAATKLKDILPWQALASKVLGASPQEIDEWETMRASDGLTSLLSTPPAA
jgi:hypothetical protein